MLPLYSPWKYTIPQKTRLRFVGGGGIRTGFFGPERNRLIAFKKVRDVAIIYSSEKS